MNLNNIKYPIFIADINSLDKCVDAIENGVAYMSTSISKIINRHPHNFKSLILDEVFGKD